jgi:hypothetical protein
MTIKKQAPAPASEALRRPGSPALDDHVPLTLSAVTVASEGSARAAFDAVAEHPLRARSAAAARATGREAMDLYVAATAILARRSAEAHSKSGATFTRAAPTTRPVMSGGLAAGRPSQTPA